MSLSSYQNVACEPQTLFAVLPSHQALHAERPLESRCTWFAVFPSYQALHADFLFGSCHPLPVVVLSYQAF